MTYPHFNFRPMTNLFPTHEHVWQYHRDYAEHFNLTSLIRFRTSVEKAEWVGNGTEGFWNVTFGSPHYNDLEGDKEGREEHAVFDHLVVANGHNHYPNIPNWPGQDEWLNAKEGREIIHSIFWRNGTKYEGKNVLVVGGGASGRDIVMHTSTHCRKVSEHTTSLSHR